MSPRLNDLPDELLLEIIGWCDCDRWWSIAKSSPDELLFVDAIKQLRLVSPRFCRLASIHLFRRIENSVRECKLRLTANPEIFCYKVKCLESPHSYFRPLVETLKVEATNVVGALDSVETLLPRVFAYEFPTLKALEIGAATMIWESSHSYPTGNEERSAKRLCTWLREGLSIAKAPNLRELKLDIRLQELRRLLLNYESNQRIATCPIKPILANLTSLEITIPDTASEPAKTRATRPTQQDLLPLKLIILISQNLTKLKIDFDYSGPMWWFDKPPHVDSHSTVPTLKELDISQFDWRSPPRQSNIQTWEAFVLFLQMFPNLSCLYMQDVKMTGIESWSHVFDFFTDFMPDLAELYCHNLQCRVQGMVQKLFDWRAMQYRGCGMRIRPIATPYQRDVDSLIKLRDTVERRREERGLERDSWLSEFCKDKDVIKVFDDSVT